MALPNITPDPESLPTLPTLADLLDVRAVQRAEEERDRARSIAAQRDLDTRAAADEAHEWTERHLSPALVDALDVLIFVDEQVLERNREDDERPGECAGFLSFTVSGEDWSLRITRGGAAVAIIGPNDYHTSAYVEWRDQPLDRHLLDAIAAYPDWLAHREEHIAAGAARLERIERERRESIPPDYHVTTAERAGDIPQQAALRPCSHVLVRYDDPAEETGIARVSAELVDVDAHWLLITVDRRPAGVGRQKLIPIARVIDVTPLAMRPDRGDDDD